VNPSNRYRRLVVWPVVGLVVALGSAGLVGCSKSVDVRPAQSCGNYWLAISDAKLGIQQQKSGSAINWGLYVSPPYKAAHFQVKVYAGGKKYDEKDQYYEPHGSLKGSVTSKHSGKIFQLVGSVTSGRDVLNFNVSCVLL
jgi:hypothetical protein